MDQFNAPQSGGALKITQYAVFIVYQVGDAANLLI